MFRFEWDENKNEKNKAKHEISFEDASDLLQYMNATVTVKMESYIGEPRELRIVQARDKKYWSIFTTMRGDIVRIISCRRARPREVQYYEKARSQE